MGVFPEGASPYGVLDMSGNVWEWCRTKWEESYENYWGDDSLEGDEGRVVRGGSFVGDNLDARCACRFGGIPSNCDWHVGFRLVLSSVSTSEL